MDIKKLLKNIFISILLVNFFTNILLSIKLNTLVYFQDADKIKESISSLSQELEDVYTYEIEELSEYSEFNELNTSKNGLLILIGCNHIISIYSNIMLACIISGIILGILYYIISSQYSKNLTTKQTLKNYILKTISTYLIFEIIILFIYTLQRILLDHATFNVLPEEYLALICFYTIAFLFLFLINYIYQKLLIKKLNKNLK